MHAGDLRGFYVFHLNRNLDFSGNNSPNDTPWELGIGLGCMHIITSSTYGSEKEIWATLKKTDIRAKPQVCWQIIHKACMIRLMQKGKKNPTDSEEDHHLWKIDLITKGTENYKEK